MGLPYADRGRTRDGIDCYGLVALVYLERLGLQLPSFDGGYAGAHERAQIAALLEQETSRWPWQPVQPGAERPMDVAMFRRGGIQSHVGVVVDRGVMVHALRGSLSCVERYTTGRWRPRLVGLYRHEDVASSPR